MTAFVGTIVQKIVEAAPIENTLSSLVAGVLENTAARLARLDRVDEGQAAETQEGSRQVA